MTSGSNVTRFLYDGDALVAEYGAAGNMLHRYVHWEGADVPMIAYNTATLDMPRNLLSDHLGSIVTLSDANGNVVALNRYDEYGIPASTNVGRFQYTGQAWLSELGIYYYKARLYSPTLGRFLQTDPVGYEGGNNFYAYVGNDPVNGADPTGLYPDIKLELTRTIEITATINDNLSLPDQATAETNLRGAAGLTNAMDSAGTLPADSAAALGALNGISVSNNIAGLNPHSGNYNINMGELSTIVSSVQNQGAGQQQAAATITASNMVHDGTHALQNRAGTLPESARSVPRDPTGRAAFESGVVRSETEANAAQSRFLSATPNPPHLIDHLTRVLREMTPAAMIQRYWGRR